MAISKSSSIPSAADQDLADLDEESRLPAAVQDIPAWGISLLVHLAVLLGLGSIGIVTGAFEPEMELISEIVPEEIPPEELAVADNAEVVGTDSDLEMAGASLAVAQQQGEDSHREEIQRLEEQLINPEIPDVEALPSPSEADFVENIDLTGTTEFAGGTEGAVDRITQEIAGSLRQRQTLVVWLFDESLSLESRRADISTRFENIYRQLGLMDVDAQNSLKTGIIGYGKDVHALLPEPTSDIEKLVSIVKSIKSDISGEERVFAAVSEAMKTYLPDKRKMHGNMMLIVVTDERGDDYNMLEEVVRRCTREGVRIYCVGNTSVFGREKGYVRTKWEFQGENFEDDIEVDQGPETAAAEGLQIPFWTASSRGLERMSAGYGPYTLSRLCSETGGIFFVADDSQGRHFDPAVMRQYSPDYRPLADYQRQLSTNSAKAALVSAARIALTDDVPIPQLQFLAANDNILREQITEAQKPLATLDYFLQQVHAALEQGEKDRDRLDSDRWRASYDLAMGRVLAMRVRAFGYNSILAEMKSSPRKFADAKNNQWRLEPSAELDAGAAVKRMQDRALEYLNRVTQDHPGTPWAFLARVELNEPLGWKWHEGYIPVAENQTPDRNAPQFAPEEEARRQQERQRQQKRQVSRPKL